MIFNSITSPCALKVSEKPGGSGPEFVPNVLVNTTAYVGERTVLNCKVISESALHIQWMKRTHEKPANSETGTQLVDSEGNLYKPLLNQGHVTVVDGQYTSKLVINAAEFSDAGLYACLAASVREKFDYRTAWLTVIGMQRSFRTLLTLDRSQSRRKSNRKRLAKFLQQ